MHTSRTNPVHTVFKPALVSTECIQCFTSFLLSHELSCICVLSLNKSYVCAKHLSCPLSVGLESGRSPRTHSNTTANKYCGNTTTVLPVTFWRSRSYSRVTTSPL